MNHKHKPFGIYHSTHKEGLWRRDRSFHTMAEAIQSFKELTKTPKEGRVRYVIWPNQDGQHRHILLKGEQIEQVYNAAK